MSPVSQAEEYLLIIHELNYTPVSQAEEYLLIIHELNYTAVKEQPCTGQGTGIPFNYTRTKLHVNFTPYLVILHDRENNRIPFNYTQTKLHRVNKNPVSQAEEYLLIIHELNYT
ncbi:hypothetical protein ACJX0J_012883, partial [Zea mays]